MKTATLLTAALLALSAAPLEAGSAWEEELAAKNALRSIEASRPYRNQRPLDAADFATRYNAEVIRHGGTHQIEVPRGYAPRRDRPHDFGWGTHWDGLD